MNSESARVYKKPSCLNPPRPKVIPPLLDEPLSILFRLFKYERQKTEKFETPHVRSKGEKVVLQ